MRRLFACLLTVASLYSFPARAMLEDYPSVKLQGLDKSVGRTVTFEAAVGSTIQYGPLYIKIQSCRKAPPIEKPESAAFLQIWEVPPGQSKSEWVFSGWMFASSPALSAMDHPVYDVWVLGCTGRDDAEPETVDPDAPPATDGEGQPLETPATDGGTQTEPVTGDPAAAPDSAAEPVAEDSEVPPEETVNVDTPPATAPPIGAYDADAPYVPDGAYAPDGGATMKTAPPQTRMPDAPAPGRNGPTPGTAYELMNMPGSRPSVSKRDGTTAYDYR